MMMTSRFSALLLTAAWFVIGSLPAHGENSTVEIPRERAREIGRMLWQNECAGTLEGLTSWNHGEDFASLGIGHFIWYPAGRRGPFEESFPALLEYLGSHGIDLPAWLRGSPSCPWNTRTEFEADRDSARMKQLRQLLADTVDLQALFAARRLRAALPKMLEAAPENRHNHIRRQFARLAAVPHGVYCLVDYVNFKGEGVRETERYKGEGWGLLQVLDGMIGEEPGDAALREFARSAGEVLRRRVGNSPPERNEQRWMAGWANRCQTYLPPAR